MAILSTVLGKNLLNILKLINRDAALFNADFEKHCDFLNAEISKKRILVVGGAGTIGQAVTKEIFVRNPKKLHVIDVSENNLVELVRDIRSSTGYITGDFRTFAIDVSGVEFESLMKGEGPYDYIFNLSALKHVRSEKDPYTLMRMQIVNIFNAVKIIKLNKTKDDQKYFCVSTDKAANPVSMMGASKQIMEMFLMQESLKHNLSMARFANVAFSDGSLLYGFNRRLEKKQPISAPYDIKRYFVTPQESGQLCLLSGLLGKNREIFFPKLNENLDLITFAEIAKNYLLERGYEPYECDTEEEARSRVNELRLKSKWPCYFFKSDTSGEKEIEEFYTGYEKLDLKRFETIGIIENAPIFEKNKLDEFSQRIEYLRKKGRWTKQEILECYFNLLPEFYHKETFKNLDQRM